MLSFNAFSLRVCAAIHRIVYHPTQQTAFRRVEVFPSYSIGGKTVHSFFKISVKDAGTLLSPAKEQQMKEDILRLLCLIIDERSLLSMDALGAAERNCSMNAHGGVDRNKDWGGIPIVLLFGDDYQLPAVVIDKKVMVQLELLVMMEC